nr:ammonia-forming cytochrome c nitrite reductase subunit c552 [Sphaerochaetaceae bacterium]
MDFKKFLKILAAVLVVAIVAVLLGVFGDDVMYHLKNRGSLGPLTREDIEYVSVEAPVPTSKDGTVNASDWEETYPYIVATMGDNRENSYITSYLEQDPYLVNIYEGFGFAKDYGSARGHEYTLEDVAATKRPHALANCLTCKTPNFAKLVNDLGVEVYKMDFDTVMGMMEESISCYTCHGNDAGNEGEIVITHSYVAKALGDNMDTIDPATLSCGQCHIEYYFTPSDKETMMPYSSIEEMTPEAILEFYDTMVLPDGSVGYSDWTQASTGAKLLKAQHPEMETFLLGKHADLLNCADCHMAIEMADDGTVYHSHLLVSPLENETLLSTCVECHGDTDMVEMVHRIQERVTARETEVGNKLSAFKTALAGAVSSGSRDE